jgi:ubiquinone/menaquinone biosynthesis C-methylase UbiE
MKNNTQRPDYGNWVPKKVFYVQWLAIIILALLTIFINIMLLRIVFCIGIITCIGFFIYFCKAYSVFSYNGGGLSGKILDMMLSHLQWNGKGTALDIGCGSGALVIKMAKMFPDAKITALDYWGMGWDYNKEQCQQNAILEGVSDNIAFLNGSASKLPFEDESFDIVVSNFTFHEVRDTKDKKELIKEALRTVKKGGMFVFHDLFYIKNLYYNLDKMLDDLRIHGIAEINIKETGNLEMIPKFLRTSFMLGGIGLIYGKK